MTANFVPDGGRYVIVEYRCACRGDDVDVTQPLVTIIEHVAGWTHVEDYVPGVLADYIPYVPVVVTPSGLAEYWLHEKPEDFGGRPLVGRPRLTLRDFVMGRSELIALHKAYHEEQS